MGDHVEHIYLKARAKVNLTLEILNKREDGYHNLKSVFQKIDLYDEIDLFKIESGFLLETNVESINNNDNIIYKAYLKLKQKYPDIGGVKVRLNKKIPMQAGLGGGSTDCASFLLGMNQLFSLKMNLEDLFKIGSELGADVVPCLYNHPLLAQGIGDVVTEIDSNFKYYFVIIKPSFSCNTKEMFQKLDQKSSDVKKDYTEMMMQAIKKQDIHLLANNLYNSFEEVVDIDHIKKELIEHGALNALLSGSGSCVFGIFQYKKEAQNVYERLKEKYEVYICSSYYE